MASSAPIVHAPKLSPRSATKSIPGMTLHTSNAAGNGGGNSDQPIGSTLTEPPRRAVRPRLCVVIAATYGYGDT